MLCLCLLSKSRRRRRWKLLGTICFLVKSVSLRLINDYDEGTKNVPGDGERKKGFIWTWARVERSRESRVSCWGVRWGGGFLCALFEAEVLTEGPWPPLSRNSLTLSLRARREHGGLTYCTAGAGREHKVERCKGQLQPTNHLTQCWAVALCLLWVIQSMFLCLMSHFTDLRVGSRWWEGHYEAVSVTGLSTAPCLLQVRGFLSGPLNGMCTKSKKPLFDIFMISIWMGFVHCSWPFSLSCAPPGVRVHLSGRPANDDLH